MNKALASMEGGDVTAAESTVQGAISILDRAVRKGVMHKNTAARRKSRIATKLNRLLNHSPASCRTPLPVPPGVQTNDGNARLNIWFVWTRKRSRNRLHLIRP